MDEQGVPIEFARLWTVHLQVIVFGTVVELSEAEVSEIQEYY